MRLVDPEERQRLLSMAVNAEVSNGAQIEEMTQSSAVLLKMKQVNHVLHLLLTVFTCFLWAIVWILVSASVQPQRFRLAVDEFGIVHRSDVPRWDPHDGLWWRDQRS
ncbi:hypothetical protein GCM10011610_56870 [Nocardia rhizosphaerihabitans]|uniref:Uncharacterized protein n=1 Tax=Nocardia rhizosphaerihabitans TaxID=1691570 RepID=A0ABQ2KUZ8_9NOCA|nr:hypothetical protein GCM10011610_56870 [Nocardia rhizosphaerihabitans]